MTSQIAISSVGGEQHYGFTEEELYFIPSPKLRAGINYDIKYRMGREGLGVRS